MNKKVTIGIVTYNSQNEIDILLTSIRNSSSFDEIEVYVIDNDSKDKTRSIVKNEYPWVQLIENKNNLGFGKAHNRIIRCVDSIYHVIVNPDISIEKDTIKEMIDYMDSNSDVAILSPYVMNIDGSQQYLPKYNPNFRYMIGSLFENKFSKCKDIREEYTMKNIEIKEPIEIEFCTGAFMFCRTSMLKKVDGFDEKYFLHFEDADLTRKLKIIGKTIYNPNIRVTHKWERDNKKFSKSFFVALKSMIIYLHKWR